MSDIRLCECGQTVPACEGAWAECLALEYVDPDFGAVHHLTVAAFMVQHPARLSAAGWDAEVDLLDEFVSGVDPASVRRRDRPPGPSLKKGPPRAVGPVEWSRTIVWIDRSGPGTYQAGVREWASSVLDDARGWIRSRAGR